METSSAITADDSILLTIRKRLGGSASSQEICHFLKMGSIERQYELEKLRNENELLKAKTESIASQKKADELYAEAMKAFGTYRGFSEDSSEEDSDD